MKIAVTAERNSLDSPVDPRFGRAHGFLIVDTESMDTEFLENRVNINAVFGAGVQASQTIAQSDAEILITGHCGPKAFAILKEARIPVITDVSGTVSDAIEQWKRGELHPTEAANVESHWE